jgi:hypothetical protein
VDHLTYGCTGKIPHAHMESGDSRLICNPGVVEESAAGLLLSTDSFCQVSDNSENDIMLHKILGLILGGYIYAGNIYFLILTYFMQGYKINTPYTLFNLFIR